MWELYFITKIGAIHSLCGTLAICSIISFLICHMIAITTDDYSGEKICTEKQIINIRKFAKNLFYTFIITLSVFAITPTTSEAYLIYGVGSTIDYLKSNDDAKQLPDKCIKALNAWVDEFTEEEK
jgi:hypothetical protein